MDPERWQKVSELFQEACERPPGGRNAFLAEACPADEELRREVESLLSQGVSIDGPLERVAELAQDSKIPEAHHLPHFIGRYRIRALLGEGGMGAVYEAEQENPRRTVALKVVRSALAAPELRRRFAQESQALARLQHPGIAQIYEAGAADTDLGPQPYFAMELIHGLSLLEYARQRGLNTRQRVELMVKVCDAVDHAHQRGIIHRDLKPGNILVDETKQPKILDFGVARVTDSEANTTRQTGLGEVVGTPAYMSPEQIVADPRQLDARSDVYSLGVLLYELLTGRLPYEVSSQLHEAARAIREEDPAPVREIGRSDRADLETIVRKTLEKDKSRRYGSAAELAADLGRFLRGEAILARPPSALYQARKFCGRHKALAGGAAAVLVVLVAGIGVSTGQAIRANRERDRALQAEQIAKAVNEFLQNDLLAQAGARAQARRSGETDPDLKVRTALDRAAERIGHKFDSQPLVEAAIRRTIGLAYYDLNSFAKAQPQLERAADLRKRALGPEHPDTLTSMDELGVLYTYQGKYGAAEALLTKVLEARKRVLGSTHKDTLGTLSNLAVAISYEGDNARAEPVFASLLEVEKRLRGEEHPDTLSVMDNLATVYARLGKYARSEALFRREVDLARRVLGPGHPDTTSSIHNLATTYRNEGKYAQADALYAEALEARRRALGEEHWETEDTRFSLGISYRAQGRYVEAASLFTQAAEALRRGLGAEHPLTLQVLYNLAEVYRRQRRYREAESLFNQVLEVRRRTLGPNNLYTEQVLASLGELKMDQGDYSEAETLLRQSASIRRNKAPDSWQRYYVESALGATLVRLGKDTEGEPLLVSGYQGMLDRQSSISAESRSALERARRWRDQLVQR
jgi:tetratricopeptide (TPR) repeat protein